MTRVFSFISVHPEFMTAHSGFGTFYWAKKNGLVDFNFINLRDFGLGKHQHVDDRPYGGGDGMLLRPEPLASATKYLKSLTPNLKTIVVFPSPAGKRFSQSDASAMGASQNTHTIFVCGRFGGVDERWIEHYVDVEISMGDFILAGGELPALAIADATLRTIPGVLGNSESAVIDSFSSSLGGKLEAPAYTRPEVFEGKQAPSVLLSGNHSKINDWRKTASREKTLSLRPDLL